MNKTINVELENFNLVTGRNSDYKTYLIIKDLKADPEVEVLEILSDTDIVGVTENLINEMNTQLEYYILNEKKQETTTKWLVIENYDSCKYENDYNKFNKFELNITRLLYRARLTNIKVLIGNYHLGMIPLPIRANMKVINADDIKRVYN